MNYLKKQGDRNIPNELSSYRQVKIFNLQLTKREVDFFYDEFIASHFPTNFTRQNIQFYPKFRVTVILYWLILKNAYSEQIIGQQNWQCRLPSANQLMTNLAKQLQQMYPSKIKSIDFLLMVMNWDEIKFSKCFDQSANKQISSILNFNSQKQRQLIQDNLYDSLTKTKINEENKYIKVKSITKIFIKLSSEYQQLPEGLYEVKFMCMGQRFLAETIESFTKKISKIYPRKYIQPKEQSHDERLWIGVCNQDQSQNWNFYNAYHCKKNLLMQSKYPYISLIIMVNSKMTIKINIKFNSHNIKEIRILPNNHILFRLNRPPQFYAQYETDEMSVKKLDQFKIWYRIINFPINYNENLLNNRVKRQIFNKNMSILLKNRYKYQENVKLLENMCQGTNVFVRKISPSQSINHLYCSLYSVETGQRLTNYVRRYQEYIIGNLSQYSKHLNSQRINQERFLKSHFIQLDYSLAIENGVNEKIDMLIKELESKHYLGQESYDYSDLEQFMNELYQKLHQKKMYLGFKQQNEIPRKQDNKVFKAYNIAITPSGTTYKGYTNEFSCRVFREFSSELFVKVTFCDDDLKPIIAQTKTADNKYVIQVVFKDEIKGFNLAGKRYIPLGWSNSQIKRSQLWYVIDHQIFNVKRNGMSYTLREDIYHFLGDFSAVDIKKRPSRIGQSFSHSRGLSCSNLIKYSQGLQQIQTPIITNPKTPTILRKYIFSDGIGQISIGLLQKIKSQLALNNNICALQIRFLGYKGVVTLGNHSFDQSYEVRMPNSMKKYECLDSRALKHFDILNWNKYSPGYVNCQIILLLLSLKVPLYAFKKRMKEFLNREVYGLEYNDDSIINYFKTHLEASPINQDSLFDLLNCILQTNCKAFSRLLNEEAFFCELLGKIKRQLSLKIKNKLRFRIQDSARLMGVLDFYDVLQQNQVYCTIKKHPKRSEYNIDQTAFITKNPCLHPSDIRRVSCISNKQIKVRLEKKGLPIDRFDYFINVIVFPQKGKYPLSALISGGDLDGDYYLLCWDQQLIPSKQPPYHLYDDGIIKEKQLPQNIQTQSKDERKKQISSYLSNKVKLKQQQQANFPSLYSLEQMLKSQKQKSFVQKKQNNKYQKNNEQQSKEHNSQISELSMQQFFLKYLQTTKIGLISSYHLLWAENSYPQGAGCSQCLKLAKAHSIELDFSKKGIRPDNIDIPIPRPQFKKYFQKKPEERISLLSKLYNLVCKRYNEDDRGKSLQVRYSNSQSWIFQIQNFIYNKDEIQQAMNVMQSYKNDIQESLRSKNMFKSSEFVIYHGRDEDLITDSIIIKQKYKALFFDKYEKQLKINDSHKIQSFFAQQTPQFHHQILRKAFLWYIISNSTKLVNQNLIENKYRQIIYEASTKIGKLKDDYLKLLKSGWFGVFFSKEEQSDDENNQQSSLQSSQIMKNPKKKKTQKVKVFENVIGLCWNVIPKVMIFLIRNLKSLK